MIKAAIFDMDGLLIDSEPLWHEAEILAFGRAGLHLTPEMCAETVGMPVAEVVRLRFAQFGWDGKTLFDVEEDIVRELLSFVRQRGEAMPGVEEALDFFESRGVRLALASSSDLEIIDLVLDKLALRERFEVVYSGEFERYPKPHPGIYLTTLEKLGISFEEAIAFEDSLPGVLAAKSARLRTVAVPDGSVYHDTRFDIADVKLPSLTAFSEEVFERLIRS